VLSENLAADINISEFLFVTVQDRFRAPMCKQFAKLLEFLLSPYSLIGTCNTTYNVL
jgi:hypothetical protein